MDIVQFFIPMQSKNKHRINFHSFSIYWKACNPHVMDNNVSKAAEKCFFIHLWRSRLTLPTKRKCIGKQKTDAVVGMSLLRVRGDAGRRKARPYTCICCFKLK